MISDFFTKLFFVSNTSSKSNEDVYDANTSATTSVGVGKKAKGNLHPDNPILRYEFNAKIGRGGYGYVYRAWDLYEEKVVAIKIINLEDVGDELDSVHQEISVMSASNCDQLTKYYASYVVDSHLLIVMEYLEGGSLSSLIADYGVLDEDSIAYTMKELLTALAYLHKEKKIHRDVKAGNILVGKNGCLKLSDFGATGQLTESINKRKTVIGTPFWMAPEVITESLYDSCVDIWSTGITAIELATGVPPYAHNTHPMQVIFLIPKNDPPKLEGAFSDVFKDFVAQCLKKNASDRPTAEMLLSHPFLTSTNSCTATDTLLANINKKCESNLRYNSSVISLFEDKGLTRVLSNDSGSWEFHSHRTRTTSGSLFAGKSSSDLASPMSSPVKGGTAGASNSGVNTIFGSRFSMPALGIFGGIGRSSENNSTVFRGSNSSIHSTSISLSSLDNPTTITVIAPSVSPTHVLIQSMLEDADRIEEDEVEYNSSNAATTYMNLSPTYMDSDIIDTDTNDIKDSSTNETSFAPSSQPISRNASRRSSKHSTQSTAGTVSSPMNTVIQILRQYQLNGGNDGIESFSSLYNKIVLPSLQHVIEAMNNDANSNIDSVSNKQVKDIVTVLIGSLTALDLLCDGKYTMEITTAIVGYMNAELADVTPTGTATGNTSSASKLV